MTSSPKVILSETCHLLLTQVRITPSSWVRELVGSASRRIAPKRGSQYAAISFDSHFRLDSLSLSLSL